MCSRAKYPVLLADARCARADDALYALGVGKTELVRRHAKEKVDKDLETVQELERQLNIADRWTTASPRWVSTTVAIKKRKYLLALNALELLIVERIFELTKMNQSQTGTPWCKPTETVLNHLFYRLQDAQAYCQGATSALKGSKERHRPL
jgi:hypothetical protein